MIKAAVLGATGYAGIELVRILSNHPDVELHVLGSHSFAGQKIDEVYKNFTHILDLDCEELNLDKVAECDIAFTAHPYEMFDTNGMELREGTVGNDHYAAEDQLENPYEMHFVTSLSNGSEGYIPSYDGFTNGGYERDTTKYAQGTGELIVGDILHVLNDLHK